MSTKERKSNLPIKLAKNTITPYYFDKFINIPYRVLCIEGINLSEAIVYGYLNEFAKNNVDHLVWESATGISKKVNISKKTVLRAIENLGTMGLIEIHKDKDNSQVLKVLRDLRDARDPFGYDQFENKNKDEDEDEDSEQERDVLGDRSIEANVIRHSDKDRDEDSDLDKNDESTNSDDSNSNSDSDSAIPTPTSKSTSNAPRKYRDLLNNTPAITPETKKKSTKKSTKTDTKSEPKPEPKPVSTHSTPTAPMPRTAKDVLGDDDDLDF